MSCKSSAAAVDAPGAQALADDAPVRGSIDLEDFVEAIEEERLRLMRTHAVAQTAAQLLHEKFILERDEPDIGFVLDVVVEMLERSVAGLDRITIDTL